jgi:hypothetical protein
MVTEAEMTAKSKKKQQRIIKEEKSRVKKLTDEKAARAAKKKAEQDKFESDAENGVKYTVGVGGA